MIQIEFFVSALIVFGGGFLIGYYLATLREHRIHMAALERLKRDLSVVEDARRRQ